MARNWIVVGDTAEGGGQVLTGSPFTDIDGKAVARIGDKALCQRHGGVFDIATGDHSIVIDGQPLARQGDRLACGCSLLAAQQTLVYVDALAGQGAEVAGPGTLADAQNAAVGVLPQTWQPPFDQAVRFVGPTGVPLAGLGYVLTLEDGAEHLGVTDSDGTTERVGADGCVGICSAVLTVPERGDMGCCARDREPESITVSLEDVTTTSADVGTSVKEVKTKRTKRRLTPGEVEMARKVFKDSIDYSTVWIHNGGYPLFFGLQNEDVAVAPNGQIYFKGDNYKPDYTLDETGLMATLIHELTHVWQYQMGYQVKRNRVLHPSMGYAYTLKVSSFNALNMEAQGNVLADYFVLLTSVAGRRAGATEFMRQNTLPMYVKFLSGFIANPYDRNHLPKTTKSLALTDK